MTYVHHFSKCCILDNTQDFLPRRCIVWKTNLYRLIELRTDQVTRTFEGKKPINLKINENESTQTYVTVFGLKSQNTIHNKPKEQGPMFE